MNKRVKTTRGISQDIPTYEWLVELGKTIGERLGTDPLSVAAVVRYLKNHYEKHGSKS